MESRRLAEALSDCFLELCGESNLDVCYLIIRKTRDYIPGLGKSSYARRRRAAAVGRCPRCYRVTPGFYYTTRCDGKTCVPGISYNEKIETYVRTGVTEVIPDVLGRL
nr:cysteine-rich protein [Chrysanthemum virus R]WBW48292.1 cysteine-rich protein [Chrysanthemum virus R]